jgi:hypothetical protein
VGYPTEGLYTQFNRLVSLGKNRLAVQRLGRKPKNTTNMFGSLYTKMGKNAVSLSFSLSPEITIRKASLYLSLSQVYVFVV